MSPQPSQVDDLANELVRTYRTTADELRGRLAEVIDNPRRFRERARLERLIASNMELLNTADRAAQQWFRQRLPLVYRLGGEQSAAVMGRKWSWTSPHLAAVAVMAQDSYGDLLQATRYTSRAHKQAIRAAARTATRRTVLGVTTARQGGREMRDTLLRQGLSSVRYRDGSIHSLDDYSEMAIRSRSASTYNAGAVLTGGSDVPYEIFDGSACGWSSHNDTDMAHGSIRPPDEAFAYLTAHPRCRRSMSPRPDLKVEDAKRSGTPPVTSDPTIREAFDKYREAAGRTSRSGRQPRVPSRTGRQPRVNTGAGRSVPEAQPTRPEFVVFEDGPEWTPQARAEVERGIGHIQGTFPQAPPLRQAAIRPGQSALGNKSNDQLLFSPDFLDDDFIANHAREFGEGRNYPLLHGTQREWVTVHEYGHILDGDLLRNHRGHYDRLDAFLNEPIPLPSGKTLPRWGSNLEGSSAYATESRYEYVAEGVTDYIRHGDKAHPNSKFIGNLLREVYG